MDTQGSHPNRWELVVVMSLSIMPVVLLIPFILLFGTVGLIPTIIGLTPVKETAFFGALIGVMGALATSAWCLLRALRSMFSHLLVDRSPFGVGWAPASSKNLIAAAGIGSLLGILVTCLAAMANLDVYPRGLPPIEVPEYFRLLAALMGVMVIVVFAPVYEEFVFRGLALSSMARRWSLRIAIFGSSLLFAASHLGYLIEQQFGLLIVLVLGLVAALLRVRHGSLESAIAFHAAYNLVLVVLVPYLSP